MPPLPLLTLLRRETIERLEELPAFKHVYDSRLPPLKREHLPAVRVSTNSANHVGLSLAIPEFRTTANLTIQIHVEDTPDPRLAERVDRYCEIVKARLMSDGEWLQLFERILSIDQEIERNADGEWRLTTATLTFALQKTCYWEPDIRDWLESVHMNVDVIDPAADPNTGPPGTPPNVDGGYPGGWPGPDGRIEVDARFINPTPPEGWKPRKPNNGG